MQLLFLHLKRNHLLLLFWLVLFGFVTQTVGRKYGIPYLFLSPEYLGEVDFRSHAILGFSVGGFVMAFNIYSYVMHGYLFPFIATLSRPFLKFSLNNFIIPGVFVATFIWKASVFQAQMEFLPSGTIALNMLGFVFGLSVFMVLSFLYFFRTNKDIFKLSGRGPDHFEKKRKQRKPGNVLHKKAKWYIIKGQKGWLVMTYMSGLFNIKLAREAKHYDNELLQKVFNQNYINASVFEILMIVTFVVLGSFREVPLFTIPAGASILLLFTIVLMLFSAFYSWFKGWTYTVLIACALLVNWGSSEFDFMEIDNHAYGLNYDTEKAAYTHEALTAFRDDTEQCESDRRATIEILNRWKQKNMRHAMLESHQKPKLVIISASGGGLRSALWTLQVMQAADSTLNGQLMNHTQLITGSSGGMIGAAYAREIYYQSLTDENIYLSNPELRERISKDMLNPIGFSIATNDIFIRYQHYQDANYQYTKDRAFAFEKQLNENTDSAMHRRLSEYYLPEREGLIPMMILSPTIVNDGRRLLISPQPISYLVSNHGDSSLSADPVVENIEFRRMFAQQDANNLLFTSALRMSATFPYILPTVTLPSEPKVEVMDAGLRDNFGLLNTVQYLWEFRHWIETNTSGVVILQIRDTEKTFEVGDREIHSISDNLTAPAGSLYSNFARIQDYSQDNLLRYTSGWFNNDLDVVTFHLREDPEEKVSLSWHLTTFEKQRIENSITLPENQAAMKELQRLIQNR